ncbi:MAG: hypothetical protein EP330_26205 [Deltaproteobacteria bacterium]|nr:MAG: hypothetical protein EP330_26205 [Deltaproteobacteria bacterium]
MSDSLSWLPGLFGLCAVQVAFAAEPGAVSPEVAPSDLYQTAPLGLRSARQSLATGFCLSSPFPDWEQWGVSYDENLGYGATVNVRSSPWTRI